MGYRDPQAYYTAANAQIAARTSASRRANLTQSLDKFAAFQRARMEEVNARNKERKTQTTNAANSFSTEYRKAKAEADKFAQSVQGEEGSNMGAQIRNALVQIGEELNNNIQDLAENASQFEINQLTDDAIVKVQRLREDLTTLYAGYEEYQAQKDMDPSEVGKIISSFNPELQLLYEKLDNDENDVILQMNPKNGHWLFIPIKKDEETFKVLKEGMELVGDEIKDSDGNVVGQKGDAQFYKSGEDLYQHVLSGAKDLEYNVDDSTGIIDGTSLTQRANENEMFKKVIGHKEDVNDITGVVKDLYSSGRFQSVDNQGNVKKTEKGLPKSKKKEEANQNIATRSYLDREMAYDYLMNDPEGISYMDTYIDNDNIDGQLQGLGIDPMTEGIDKRWALRNALVEKALLKISTPKKQNLDDDDAQGTAKVQVPNPNAVTKPN